MRRSSTPSRSRAPHVEATRATRSPSSLAACRGEAARWLEREAPARPPAPPPRALHDDPLAQALAAQNDALVVEGAGGLLVPLSIHPRLDSAEVFAAIHQALGLPVVLVVGMRLGCINHALLTAEVLAARGLPLAGWVANCVETAMPYLDDNILALQALLPAPLLGTVPYMPELPLNERVKAAAQCLQTVALA